MALRVPWKKLGLSLFVGVPLALVAVEATFRVVQWARGQPYSSDKTYRQLRRIQGSILDFVPRPDEE